MWTFVFLLLSKICRDWREYSEKGKEGSEHRYFLVHVVQGLMICMIFFVIRSGDIGGGEIATVSGGVEGEEKGGTREFIRERVLYVGQRVERFFGAHGGQKGIVGEEIRRQKSF